MGGQDYRHLAAVFMHQIGASNENVGQARASCSFQMPGMEHLVLDSAFGFLVTVGDSRPRIVQIRRAVRVRDTLTIKNRPYAKH